ncbi:glutamine synthetase family protein [Labrys monachus]|uniref:Glutamine synthetase n=1 Tax=Labrys monachus TaxID=217067 RepID=A0ABU0FCJ4_9HYPH|nr:glutamine synthetase family protein [Labrys monachus]MDQ0392256.1 glutamine synthetase [Labrys monachus]
MGFQTLGVSDVAGDEAAASRPPPLDTIEVLLPDTNAILRGKWLPGSALDKIGKDGVAMPLSMFGLDVWGREVEETGIHIETGDKDGLCRPVPGTLKPVPWAARPTMQALLSMDLADGRPWMLNPRHILQSAVDRFAELGLRPVVAFELEFYLLRPDAAPGGAPRTVFHRAEGPAPQNMYSISDLDDLAAVIQDMRTAAQIQGLPADSVISEAAPGQFEINLHHRGDAMAAADDAVLLRRLIRGVARKHGLRASFMPKPYLDCAGSGMHVHASLLDAAGANAFADGETGEVLLRRAVGGLLAHMPDTALMFVSSYNGFRRLMPGSYAPVSPSWGWDNRSVAVRIPNGGPAARRVEHRIAGADANPYLVLAAILAAMEDGIRQCLPAPEPVSGNAYDLARGADAPTLPATMREAVERFRGSAFNARNFGARFSRIYAIMKELECAEFERRISDLEYQTYL